MSMLTFARRNFRELIRDPLTVFFGAAFPLVLLFLLSAIQANIPVTLFAIDALAPGIAVFGQSFLTLFAALLIARDRTTALTQRLMASPMTGADFILGYALPLLPLALLQALLCLLVAGVMGLSLSHLPLTLAVLLVSAVFYIAMGLLFGSILNDKQVGGICGALLTNLSAWISGIWFDVKLIGGAFVKIANALPFIHAVEAARAAAAGNLAALPGHLAVVAAYGAALLALSVFAFLRAMRGGKR